MSVRRICENLTRSRCPIPSQKTDRFELNLAAGLASAGGAQSHSWQEFIRDRLGAYQYWNHCLQWQEWTNGGFCSLQSVQKTYSRRRMNVQDSPSQLSRSF